MSDAGFILNATNELYRIFDALNENYFDGKLPKVVITIQSSVKAYGHFSSDRWKNKAEENEIIPDKEVEVAKDKKRNNKIS